MILLEQHLTYSIVPDTTPPLEIDPNPQCISWLCLSCMKPISLPLQIRGPASFQRQHELRMCQLGGACIVALSDIDLITPHSGWTGYPTNYIVYTGQNHSGVQYGSSYSS